MSELVINGYKLVFKQISPLAPKSIEMQYRKQNPEPKVPTYNVEAVAGIVEVFKHDATTVETDEEKADYLAWKEKHDEWSNGLTYKLLRLFLSQGVHLDLTKKQVKDLEVQSELLGIELPENDSERNLFFLETFVITSPSLVEKVIQGVLEETGIKETAIDAANALFPA